MRLIFVQSHPRLRALEGRKPKYIHGRFNIDALTMSPFMAFPHFQAMTSYLTHWFDTREVRRHVESARRFPSA
jgi:hypothetical protein